MVSYQIPPVFTVFTWFLWPPQMLLKLLTSLVMGLPSVSSCLTSFSCSLPPSLSICLFLFLSPSLVTLSLKHHSNLRQGIGCQETGFIPHCMSTKVEGVGGGVTISSTAENWRPWGLHSTIMAVLKNRKTGTGGREQRRWWVNEMVAVGV